MNSCYEDFKLSVMAEFLDLDICDKESEKPWNWTAWSGGANYVSGNSTNMQ
jgi:hypothetical protein